MALLQRKLYFPKDPEGVQHFQGRSIQGGILIAITITCDFLGRGGGSGLRGVHSSKIILKLFKKEKRGSLKTWKHILPVTKSTLRPGTFRGGTLFKQLCFALCFAFFCWCF